MRSKYSTRQAPHGRVVCMESNSLTFKALRNITYNIIGYGWPFIFSVAITPIIVLKLGVQQYGLFIFINTISSLLGVISSGVEASSIKYLSEYTGKNDPVSIRKLVSTIHALFLIVAFTGSIIIIDGFLIGTNKIPQSVNTDHAELFFLFCIVALNYFISTGTKLFQVIPNALERFDISAKLSIILSTATSLMFLILVLSGHGVKSMIVTQLIISIIMICVMIRISTRLLPEGRYSLGIDKSEIKKYIHFSSLSAFNNLANTSLFSLDRVLIPIFSGVSSLTYYSLPGNISARIPGVSDILTSIIFPAASNLHAAGKTEQLKMLYVRSSRLILLVSVAISTTIILYADTILRYWLNESFAKTSTSILIILVVTSFIISLLSPVASFLLGMNKIKFNTILSVAMATLNVGLLIILLPKYGIVGAAWAYLISVTPIFYSIYKVEKKYLLLVNRFAYYTSQIIKHAIIIAIISLVSIFIKPFVTSFTLIAIVGPATVILYMAVFILLGFPEKNDTEDIGRFVKKIFRRNKIKAQ